MTSHVCENSETHSFTSSYSLENKKDKDKKKDCCRNMTSKNSKDVYKIAHQAQIIPFLETRLWESGGRGGGMTRIYSNRDNYASFIPFYTRGR